MGLPSNIALTIIKFQTDREQTDTLLMDSMNIDISFGKFLQDTNFNDLQLLDLHDIEFIDLDTERVSKYFIIILIYFILLLLFYRFGHHGILMVQFHHIHFLI